MKTQNFSFDKRKHIIKVLRKKDADILHVTNGNGLLFTTQITIASDNKCTVDIISFIQIAPSTQNFILQLLYQNERPLRMV
jgi:16S rRNA (uracil1498-N3)-methyltransferase